MLNREKIRKHCGDVGTQSNYGKRTRVPLVDPQNKKNNVVVLLLFIISEGATCKNVMLTFFKM